METEDLIRRAHTLLQRHGITLSPSKVSRLVRAYRHKAAPRGVEFDQYLMAEVGAVAHRRANGTLKATL